MKRRVMISPVNMVFLAVVIAIIVFSRIIVASEIKNNNSG